MRCIQRYFHILQIPTSNSKNLVPVDTNIVRVIGWLTKQGRHYPIISHTCSMRNMSGNCASQRFCWTWCKARCLKFSNISSWDKNWNSNFSCILTVTTFKANINIWIFIFSYWLLRATLMYAYIHNMRVMPVIWLCCSSMLEINVGRMIVEVESSQQ